MKKIIVFALLSFSLLLATSCKKDDSTNDPQSLTIGTMVAKIDGEDFSSTTAIGVLADFGAGALFTIVGTNLANGSVEALEVIMTSPSGGNIDAISYPNCGSSSVGETCGIVAYINTASTAFSSDPDEGGSSSISFSSIDYEVGGTASGSFSGTLVDTDGNMTTITDGKFNVKIQQ